MSSVFFMCLPNRVSVFGDCAVNPNPTAEQLADIAISSAETSKMFGIDPKVAMLSYSSGTSGEGEDVALRGLRPAQDRFRCGVGRGAEGLAGLGENRATDGAGDSEIDDLGPPR